MRIHRPLNRYLLPLIRQYFMRRLYMLIALVCLNCAVQSQTYYPGGLGNAKLQLWLHAGDAATLLNNSSSPITNSGERILSWNDKSGNFRHARQFTTARQPIYRKSLLNDMGGVVFNSTTQFLTGGAGPYQSIVAVRNLPGPGHYETLFASPANTDFSIRGGGMGTSYTDGPKTSDWTYNTGNPPTQWLNGVQSLNATSSDHLLVSTSAYPTNSDYSISTQFLNRGMSGGDAVYEILAYSSPLNTTQRRILENYAAAGWGLSGLLPAGTNTTFTPPAAATFNKNLIGIGYTNPTDYFLSNPARGTDGLAFSSGTGPTDFLNTEGYLMAAHNGQANSIITNTSINGIGNGLNLWNRSWYFQKIKGNDRGYVTLDFNFNNYIQSLLPASYGNFYLLYNATDGTFSSGSNTVIAINHSTTSTTVQFYVQANLLSNGYYTLMWSSPTTRLVVPGAQAACVGENMVITALTARGFDYQWQVNRGSGFTNVPAIDPGGAEYSGNTTASLSITGVSAGMNGYTYQCLLTPYGGPTVRLGPASITVKASPVLSPITGPMQVMAGASATLTNTTPGGIWTTSHPSIALVNNSGMVTGLSNGSTRIVYTLSNANGCSASVSTNFTVLASRYFPGGLGNAQLQLWLDAADNATIRTGSGQQASEGDPITTWYDKSSKSNHATQTQAHAQPVYQSNKLNNQGAVVFSDATKNLTGPFSAHQTIVAVRDLPGAGHYQTLFASPAHGDFSIRGGGDATDYTDGPKNTDWSFNTGNPPEHWLNGKLSLSGIRTAHILVASTPSRVENTYSISSAFDGRGMNGNDAVYELLSYDSKLNTTQRHILENYKAAKWGLSSTLPTTGYTTFIPPSISSYNKNLVGIGYTNSSDHFLANPIAGPNGSTDGLGFSSGSGTADYLNSPGYLMAAHNAQAATILNNATIPSINAQGGAAISRWNRSWYLQKTGGNAGGKVTLNFNFDDYFAGNANSSYTYSILYNAIDGNFTTGNNTLIPVADNTIVGNNIAFQVRAGDLSNGYYTLIWSSAALLALEINYFTATRQDNMIALKWSSKQKLTNIRFRIQRQTKDQAFTDIGEVAADASTLGQYIFTDQSPASGQNRYRLKIIDSEQRFTYSEIRFIDFPASIQSGFSIYPNPSAGTIFITASQFKGLAGIRLLTMEGRVLLKMDQQFDKKTSINVSNYPAGVYLLEITAEGRIFHQLIKKL